MDSSTEAQPGSAFGPSGLAIYERTYSRTKPDGTKEVWPETVERVVTGNLALVYGPPEQWTIEAQVEHDDLARLIGDFAILPAGRHLWATGVKSGMASQNCWVAPNDDLETHCRFLLEQLMAGGGCGSRYGADAHFYPAPLRQLRLHLVCSADHPDHVEMRAAGLLSEEYGDDWQGAYQIQDSRRGWADALCDLVESFYRPGIKHTNRVYDLAIVRPAGARLKASGGTASGPAPLAAMLLEVARVLNRAAASGWALSALDVMEIDHSIAAAVVAGGVRRSARMSIVHWADPDVEAFIKCKTQDGAHFSTNISVSTDDVFWQLAEQPNSRASEVLDLIVAGMLLNGEPGVVNESNANEGELRYVGCSNPCQPASAIVITPKGVRTFGDVGVGDRIWSEDGWVTITAKTYTGVKPVYRYATTAGTVEATEEHRIKQRGVKVELRDAVGIDRLAGPACSAGGDPQAIMDGLVLGDGYLHKASAGKSFLCIGARDQDYFTSEVAALIGNKAGNAHRVESTLTLEEAGGRNFERRIPDRYLHGDPTLLSSFLRGLYTANGSVVGGRVTLKTAGYALMRDVQMALSSIGISSYFTTNAAHEIRWDNGMYTSRQSYDLNIGRVEDIARFASSIGFIQAYKNDKVSRCLARTATMRTQCFPITGVEPMGEIDVWDITVDGPSHTYWSGGHNVSNCSEIFMENWEPCVLGQINLEYFRPGNAHELEYAHKLLTRFLIRATFAETAFEKSREVMDRNRRIGLGHLGIAGYLAMRGIKYSQAGRSVLFERQLRELKQVVDEEAAAYAFELRIPRPIKVTAIAPTGTISKLAGATEGIAPIFARHYIRRIRYSATDPEQLAKLDEYRAQGHHVEPDLYAAQTMVVSIPMKDYLLDRVPDPSVIEDQSEISLDDRMELQYLYGRTFVDNAVSNTITIDPGQVTAAELRAALLRWGPLLKGCTVFPSVSRAQSPYEKISEEEFNRYQSGEVGNSNSEDCQGGSCPIR